MLFEKKIILILMYFEKKNVLFEDKPEHLVSWNLPHQE